MLFSLTKLVALVFGLIVIAKTMTDFRQKKENWQLFLFWLVIWLAIIVIAFNPVIVSKIINHFGGRGATIGQILGMGLIFVLFIVYRVYVKAHRLEKQLNQLIRKLALRDFKKGKKK